MGQERIREQVNLTREISQMNATANDTARRYREPGVAAVLSLLIPGVGQFYNGAFLRGLFWLIITPGLWIGSGGMLGWICHVISAVTAYNYAKKSRSGSG